MSLRMSAEALLRLLGRQVIDGPYRAAGAGDAIGFLTGVQCQAHVGQFDAHAIAVARQQKVRRLDVAMGDALLEGVLERLDGLDENAPRFFRRQPPLAFDIVIEVDAIDVFQGEEIHAVGLPVLVERDDVFVRQPGGMAGFATKTLQGIGLVGHLGIKHFQGDGAAQFLVGRLVDDAHPPRGDVLQDLVFAKAGARIKRLRGHENARFRQRGNDRSTLRLLF